MSDWINTVVQMARQYRQSGQPDLAESMLQKALASEPEHAMVNIEFGSLQIEQGKFESGLRYLQRASDSALDSGDAHFRLGRLYRQLLLHEDSVREYREAVRLEPSNYAYKDALIFSLAYCPNTDLIEDYEVSRATGAFIESNTPRLFSQYKNNGRKIRIGYLGSTLHAHSVTYFLLPILENHSDQFEIYCYHLGEKEDSVTQRIKKNCTVYRQLHLKSLKKAAGIIHEDMIDVLVDLDGYTSHRTLQLLAYKPAPLQFAWIGYPDTSGMTRMDYRIVDKFTDPDTELINAIHSEELIRMPRSFSIYAPPDGMPDVNETPAKRNGYVTFGSFNKPLKINDDVIEVWASVLAEIPHSILVLKHSAYAQAVSRWRIITMFEKHGISEDRVKFRGGDELTETHFGRYHDIDIALDTFPYNGTTTTCESLWMGVPVITLAGDKHISRVGISLLNSVECAEFIATDRDEYVKIAKRWSANIEKLNDLRQVLRRKMIDSPLMNAKEFVGDLERRLSDIWLNHQ